MGITATNVSAIPDNDNLIALTFLCICPVLDLHLVLLDNGLAFCIILFEDAIYESIYCVAYMISPVVNLAMIAYFTTY